MKHNMDNEGIKEGRGKTRKEKENKEKTIKRIQCHSHK